MAVFGRVFGGHEPLSRRERTALVRILSASARDQATLAPRQRAALDAYASILSSPPLVQSDVVSAARAMIKIWSEIGAAIREKMKSTVPVPKMRKQVIPAELLELEDVFADSVADSATEMMAPRSPVWLAPAAHEDAQHIDPFAELAADLLEDIASESSTEVLEPITPDWRSPKGPRIHASYTRP